MKQEIKTNKRETLSLILLFITFSEKNYSVFISSHLVSLYISEYILLFNETEIPTRFITGYMPLYICTHISNMFGYSDCIKKQKNILYYDWSTMCFLHENLTNYRILIFDTFSSQTKVCANLPVEIK